MTQPRRTSTTKQMPRGLVELSDSHKNAQQVHPSNPIKPRRPPAPRNTDVTKPHPKEFSPLGDAASEPPDSAKEHLKTAISGKEMGVANRRFWSTEVVPGLGVQMLISLPFASMASDDPHLKDMVSSETLDDLESTTRGDLLFYPERIHLLRC
jgi:hypothetical protein